MAGKNLTGLDAELLAVLNEPVRVGGRRRVYPPDVAMERQRQQSRRSARAHSRASLALARLHRDQFRLLYKEALARINAEAGPLPGDDNDGT